MDVDSTLQEYQIQLEQVEIALKSDPDNEELSRLKLDLLEVIQLTKELQAEEAAGDEKKRPQTSSNINWKPGQKCMALWRADGKYYPGTLDQVLEDGTCTVIFEDKFNSEISQVSQLLPYDPSAVAAKRGGKTRMMVMTATGGKKPITKKELELKLREAKKKKKEKFEEKIRLQTAISEKQKNNWQNFNSKLSAKTWKGVVKKNKFVVPENHESRVGVGINSANNRVVTANGTILAQSSSASASAALVSSSAKARQQQQQQQTSSRQ